MEFKRTGAHFNQTIVNIVNISRSFRVILDPFENHNALPFQEPSLWVRAFVDGLVSRDSTLHRGSVPARS